MFGKKLSTLTRYPHRTRLPLQGRRTIQLGVYKLNLGLAYKGHSNGAKLSKAPWMRGKCQGRKSAFEIGPANGPDVGEN